MPKFLSKSENGSGYKCSVTLLEDTDVLEFEFQANQKGKFLIDRVCEELNLVENDYFGLRYVDIDKQRHWLDSGKSILKQVRDLNSVLFSFRVKFYPPNPFQLKECITRYQIYLQLKRDLLHGRLYCETNVMALLGAYILQAELGNYDPNEHIGNYASQFKILLKQTLVIEEKMMEIHQMELTDMTPDEMEANFLRLACTLDTYGIDPHVVKDQRGSQQLLGINYSGILTFQGNKKTNHFRWTEVQKLNYEGKMFIIHLIYFEKKQTVGFKCPSTAACRHVWRCAIEQMLFFTSPSSNVRIASGGSFFSWGSKFKYSGRVEREVLEEMEKFLRDEPPINRVGSLRRKASSVPATPSTPIVSDMGYSTMPNSNYSLESRGNFGLGEQIPIHYNADGSSILHCVDEDNEQLITRGLSRYKADEVDLNNSEYSPNFTDGDIIYSNDDCELNDKGGSFRRIVKDSSLLHNQEILDHSASESHLPGSMSRFSSRSVTPIGRNNIATTNSGYFSHKPKSISAQSSTRSVTLSTFYYLKKFQLLLRSCLPSIILTLTSLLAVIIFIYETDYEIFALLRRAPEMVAIRREYYEPAKEYLLVSFNQIRSKWKF